jgi:UDP-glucose 4-epimerase
MRIPLKGNPARWDQRSGWLGRDIYLDISRLREDTGFQPGCNTTAAVADYIGWLRSGNER